MSNFTRSSLQSIFSHEWTRNIKILKYRIHSCQFQRNFEMGSLIFSIKINETQFNFHVITTWIFLFDEIKREDLFFTHNYVSSLFHFPCLIFALSNREMRNCRPGSKSHRSAIIHCHFPGGWILREDFENTATKHGGERKRGWNGWSNFHQCRRLPVELRLALCLMQLMT